MNPLLMLAGAYGIYKLLEEYGGESCPKATQNIALNTKNRQSTIDDYGYGPQNPSAPNLRFWKKYAQRFVRKNSGQKRTPTPTEIEEAKKNRCWNCAAFDVSPEMEECLPPFEELDIYDEKALRSRSFFGYCWMHHFKCASARTCDTWAGGGPIKTNKMSEKWARKYQK